MAHRLLQLLYNDLSASFVSSSRTRISRRANRAARWLTLNPNPLISLKRVQVWIFASTKTLFIVVVVLADASLHMLCVLTGFTGNAIITAAFTDLCSPHSECGNTLFIWTVVSFSFSQHIQLHPQSWREGHPESDSTSLQCVAGRHAALLPGETSRYTPESYRSKAGTYVAPDHNSRLEALNAVRERLKKSQSLGEICFGQRGYIAHTHCTPPCNL